METVIIGAILLAGAVIGGAAAAIAARRRRRRVLELVRRTPLRTAASLAGCREQLVATEGRVRALRTLRAPLSGATVVAYHVTLRYQEAARRSERQTVTDRRVDWGQLAEFEVVDETGSARVRGESARLLAVPREFDAGDVSVALTQPEIERLVLEQGVSILEVCTAHSLRGFERLLVPDSPVYVCGGLTSEVCGDGAGSTFREPPTRAVVSAGGRPPELIIADCPRAGLLADPRGRVA